MRAVQIHSFNGPESLRIATVSEPHAAPGEVVIKVAFCGVNPVDRSQTTGRWQWLPLPHIPGSEIAGTIVELGTGVSGLRIGQPVAAAFRIFCGRCSACLEGADEACDADPHSTEAPIMIGLPDNGGYAEYVAIPAANAIPLPDGMSLTDACVATLDGVTAWHEIERARLRTGERVLVTGATGGLGTFFIQMAYQRGATVYAFTGKPEMVGKLRELGAQEVIVRGQENLPDRILQLTQGQGVNVVLDSLGGTMIPTALACLARRGRLVYCGILTGATTEINLAPFYTKQLELIGSTGGSRRDLQQVLNAIAHKEITTNIWQQYGLEEASTAMQGLNDSTRFGKIILSIS
ncbi:MAG: zinc-binding dehydrogenase [Chloroflexi bacterium]|nr:zinc-binding dehydrogenase [Chloroflexota bacterium]